jgi:hypothetical protein
MVTFILLGLLLAIAALIFVGYVGGVGWSLYPTIIRSRRAIRKILKKRGFSFRVHSFGATSIDPQYLCICINVDTDSERDSLRENTELIDQFREAMLRVGYPAESVPLVGFSFESQQTVDRDFAGNWFYARK